MKRLINITTAFILLISLPVIAGSTQNLTSQFPIEEVEKLAKSVEKYAASKGARAFLIAQ